MRRACILFTRVPEAGKTKTRLLPSYTPRECAEIHKAFLKDIYLRTHKLDADIFVSYTQHNNKKNALKLYEGAKGVFPQEGDDIGERMKKAMWKVLDMGYDKVLLFGSDLPEIDENILEECFEALDSADIVLSPTIDGGYYLAGMKKRWDIFNLKAWSHEGVFCDTVGAAKKLGLTVKRGPELSDIDTPEDMEALKKRIEQEEVFLPETQLFLLTRSCVHCGRCKKECSFLGKYDIDLKGLSERPELGYSCFFCNTCKDVCPFGIDGKKIALLLRRKKILLEGGMPHAAYRALRFEKDPYRFQNYKRAPKKSVLFTGCNFPSFYPRLTDKIIDICASHEIGVVHDCCSKPIYEIGLKEHSDRNIKSLEKNLKEKGITELVFLCPNCYYFLKDQMDFKMTTIYEKLSDLGEGRILKGKIPYYAPCPDREDRRFEKDLEKFIPDGFSYPLKKLQCCGLGGCAGYKEPNLARNMAKTGGSYEGAVYTACASCAGNFKRAGNLKAEHILCLILGSCEKLPPGPMSFLNRAKWKWRY